MTKRITCLILITSLINGIFLVGCREYTIENNNSCNTFDSHITESTQTGNKEDDSAKGNTSSENNNFVNQQSNTSEEQSNPANDMLNSSEIVSVSQPSSTVEDNGMKPISEGEWKQEEFYISTFAPISVDSQYMENSLRLCKEAGLNLIEVRSTSVIEMCKRVGLKTILDIGKWKGNEYTEKSLYTIMSENQFNSNNIGYYTWDEVPAGNLKDAKKKNAVIEKYDPARLPYSILYPSYGKITWNTDYRYDEYVKDYLDIVNPMVLSFDYYPIHAFGLRSNNVKNVMTCEWWRDMGLMRKLSNEYNKPFWYYVQSVDIETSSVDYITQPQIALQLYAGLAYGADCLSYYLTPGYIYSKDGKEKTDHFDEGAALNERIMNIGKLLFARKSEKIYHTGFSATDVLLGINNKFYLDKLSNSDLISSAPDDLIISQFDGEDGKYLLVVNKNYVSSAVGNLTIKTQKRVSQFNANNGVYTNLGTIDSIKLNIQPGEGVVYIIK